MDLLRKKGMYHALFWVGYYLFAVSISLTIHRIYEGRFYLELLTLVPPDMALVYLNLYVLVPKFLLKKKFIFYVTTVACAIFAFASLTIWMHKLYAQTGTAAFAGADFNLPNYAGQFLNSIYLLGLTMGIKYVKDWMLQEKQLVATELDFLKSQIHPHFFFNTLNNLYSLTVQKSDLAPDVVLKLSELMNFMLYESGAPTVPLDKEIGNLENYIAIEKLRYGNRISLVFEKEGDTGSVHIPPLLLMPFVENSFKHGAKHSLQAIRIEMKLNVSPGQLRFEVSNPAPPPRQGTNGIGLKNVGRRLDLLYGKKYTLDLTQEDNVFSAHLKIPVS